jgi:hypothetical protein
MSAFVAIMSAFCRGFVFMTDPATDISLSDLALGQLMNDVSERLDGLAAIDVLAVAGLLATRALRCLPEPDERMDAARAFGAQIISCLEAPT